MNSLTAIPSFVEKDALKSFRRRCRKYRIKNNIKRLNEKQLETYNRYHPQSVYLINKELNFLIDLTMIILEYAEIKDYIEMSVLWKNYSNSCINKDHLIIERPIGRHYLSMQVEIEVKDMNEYYWDAREEYGPDFIETYFYEPEIHLENKLFRLMKNIWTTSTITFINVFHEERPSIIVKTDEESFNFDQYYDVFQEYELDIVPSTSDDLDEVAMKELNKRLGTDISYADI